MSGDLVWMSKGGETLPVHPTCVAAHAAIGWIVTDEPAQAEEQPAPTKPKRAPKGAAPQRTTEA